MISKFGILYVSLIALETLVAFVLLFVWGLLTNPSNNFDKQIYDASSVVLINLWRLMFYSIPLILIFWFSFKYFNRIEIYKPIVFSIFNVLVFAGLNLLYKLHKGLPTLEFTESLFWVTILSIFLSPIILGQIPYFKRLMESI